MVLIVFDLFIDILVGKDLGKFERKRFGPELVYTITNCGANRELPERTNGIPSPTGL